MGLRAGSVMTPIMRRASGRGADGRAREIGQTDQPMASVRSSTSAISSVSILRTSRRQVSPGVPRRGALSSIMSPRRCVGACLSPSSSRRRRASRGITEGAVCRARRWLVRRSTASRDRQALFMPHEGNDIATPVAPATIPDLLMPIDAEPIAPTADRARPSAFDGP